MALRNALAQAGQFLAEEGFAFEYEFRAVMLRRIVRTRDHDRAIGFQMVGGEIAHGGGAEPAIEHMRAAALQPFGHRIGEVGGTEAPVAHQHDHGRAALGVLGHMAGECLPDGQKIACCQCFVGDAANVVGTKE